MDDNFLFSSKIYDSLALRFPDSCVDFFQPGDCILDRSKLEILEPPIARGAFGMVHRGIYDGENVAVKVQKVPVEVTEECTNVMVELSLMQSFPHEKLVSYIGATCTMVDPENTEVSIF